MTFVIFLCSFIGKSNPNEGNLFELNYFEVFLVFIIT